MPESPRIDKWLWAARFFKTRAIAAEMCSIGKVKRASHSLKPGSTPHPGDLIEIPFPEGPGIRTIRVLSILQKRVGAPEARESYEELTLPEVFENQKEWHRARLENPGGRPTKKNRRDLDKIHGFWD